ncbi:hypothetical protein VTK26DRAFT_6728 [Humicola hyalothermophila]
MPHVVRLRQGLKVGWCCDKGRNFLIFSLLCGPGPEPPNMMPRVLAALMARSLLGRRRSPLPQGVGYSSHSIFGSRSAAAVARRPVEDSARVAELQAYFWALALVLPNMARAGGTARFDTSPQELVTVMVPRSPMLKLAYELLRGADMTQMCSTESPLGAVLDFLDALSSHWSTGRYLVCERNLYPASEQLPAVVAGLGNRNVTSSSSSSSSSTATPTTATTTPAAPTHFETAEPFHVVLNELAIRCRRFVESSVRVKLNDPPSTVLMRRICSMAELLQQTRLRADPGPSGGSAAPSVSGEEAARRAASAWHRAHCVQELPDAQILASFMLAEEEGEREHLGGARPLLLGRMRKLLAQLASLSTDLPEGIYVRHGESRPDLIKVMITGPVGTPYENGLFEFDMYCGIYFPIVPPKMIFRTTGTRAARFNPNLYTDGRGKSRVAKLFSDVGVGIQTRVHPLTQLSPLQSASRSWEHGAAAHGSRIGQRSSSSLFPSKVCFLVRLISPSVGKARVGRCLTNLDNAPSTPAMIFTESPYYNEPGNEHSCNRRKSNLYNRSIEWMTVRFAMVSWLQRTLADPNKLKGKGKTVEAADTSSASSVDSSSSSSSSSNAFLFPSLSTHPLPRRWGGSANDHDDPVWGEVVRHHFSTRARDALQTARVWEQLGRGTDFAGRIAKAADDLEIAAKAHGFL